MSNIEHYFENLLFTNSDCNGEPNKKALSQEVQDAVEICADYVMYTLFDGREELGKFFEQQGLKDSFRK